MRGISASPPATCFLPSLQSRTQATLFCNNNSRAPGLGKTLLSWSNDKPLDGLKFTREGEPCPGPRAGCPCNSSTGPGGPTSGPGESDNRSVLDAFFLGKALAEALNERVESAVGEFLSTIGRLQAEQQKQIQEFQEDVLERAKKAKEKAAREALETQGMISKPITVDTPGVAESVSVASSYTVIPADTDPSTAPDSETDADPATKDSALGASNVE